MKFIAPPSRKKVTAQVRCGTLFGVQNSVPVSVAPPRKLKPSLEIARISMHRAFLVWLGSVYQLLFASLGSCCGVHHSPQNSGGMVGGSALAALAPSAVVGRCCDQSLGHCGLQWSDRSGIRVKPPSGQVRNTPATEPRRNATEGFVRI